MPALKFASCFLALAAPGAAGDGSAALVDRANADGTHAIFPKQIRRTQALAAGENATLVQAAIGNSAAQKWSLHTP